MNNSLKMIFIHQKKLTPPMIHFSFFSIFASMKRAINYRLNLYHHFGKGLFECWIN